MAKRGHNRKKGQGTAAGIRAYVKAHMTVMPDDEKEREAKQAKIDAIAKGAKKTSEELDRERQFRTRSVPSNPRRPRGTASTRAIREQL